MIRVDWVICGFICIKGINDWRFSEFNMESRAHAAKNKEVVDVSLDSQVEKLENTIQEQKSKMDKHIAEMFEAINMLSTSNINNRSPSRPSPSFNHVLADADLRRRSVSIHLMLGLLDWGSLILLDLEVILFCNRSYSRRCESSYGFLFIWMV